MTDETPPPSYPQGYPQGYPAHWGGRNGDSTPTRPAPSEPCSADVGIPLSRANGATRASEEVSALLPTLLRLLQEGEQGGQTVERRLANLEAGVRALLLLMTDGQFKPPRQRARRGEGRVKVDDPRVMAANFIRTMLRERGPLTWRELAALGERFNQAEITLRRARDQVAILDRRGGLYLWRLKNSGTEDE